MKEGSHIVWKEDHHVDGEREDGGGGRIITSEVDGASWRWWKDDRRKNKVHIKAITCIMLKLSCNI